MLVLKIDMHCHTKEGSLDAKVPVEQYIERLKELGFGGMVITDHDSYKGYRAWKKDIKGNKHTDFLVLKGIEYDTFGAGHILVIMPETVKLRILEMRGLPAHILISIVHSNGGILGPAHPYGEKYMSLAHTRAYRRDPRIMKRFDFVETFNSCEPQEANEMACKLAAKYHKVGIGGSDSHRYDCIGTAYTEVPDDITCESDLIASVLRGDPFAVGGTLYKKTKKDKIGQLKHLLAFSFYVYNKVAGLVKVRKRNVKLKDEFADKESQL